MQNEARIYSKSLEGDKQLTSSFKVKEFACNDGSDVILIHPDLPAVLQNIRNQFGKPIFINGRNIALHLGDFLFIHIDARNRMTVLS
jgi:hypothetical protein